MNTKEPLELTLLRRLVEMPTVSGNFSSNNLALDFISAFLGERGMHIVRKEYNGYGALVATTRPTKTPTLMLAAHVDVVDAPDALFRVREAEDKLYGRGVYDMKFAIAGYMALVDKLQKQLARYDFGIMITSDEESYDRGVTQLLDDGFLPKGALLLDGGREWHIEKAAKGAWCFKVHVSGKTAHSSRPWDGENASLKLYELLKEINHLLPQQTYGTNTLNISAVHAGQPGKIFNQVPDTAWATLDLRFTSQVEYERISTDVLRLCRQYEGTCETIILFPALIHDTSDVFIASFSQSIEEVRGTKCEEIVSLAVSDAIRFQAYGIPCAVTYPHGGGHHSEGEWVDRTSLMQLVPILQTYIHRVAAVAAGPKELKSTDPYQAK